MNYVEKTGVGVIFPECNVNLSSLDKVMSVAKEKGIPLKMSEECLYSDSLGSIGSETGTYLGMMRHNAKVVMENLTGFTYKYQ